MKILVVTQYFYPESFRVNSLTQDFVNRGHDVTVLTAFPQYPYGEIYDGYGFDKEYKKVLYGAKIVRLKVPARGHNVISLFKNCYKFVSEGNKWVKNCNEKFDAVYVFEVSPVTVGLPAIKYKKKFNTPVFFNVQDLWPDNVIEVLGVKNKLVIAYINKIVDKIYRGSDTILCSSKGFLTNINARGIDKDKLVFWPQFCETPNYDNLVKPKCYDDKFFNIVFTGNIGYAQGLELLVDAAKLLKDSPVRWYIVGDGRAKDELVAKVKENELDDQVRFIGRLSENDANAYVRYADCAYLSFSDTKLFDLTIPAKLQTYLACGTPILGAVGGESAEIINEASCGVVAAKNPEDVAEKVKYLMNLSDSDVMSFRSNAEAYFNRNFRIDKVIDDLEVMFNESLPQSNR